MVSKQVLGGLACGVINKAKAIKKYSEDLKFYNNDPNICKHCLKAIAVNSGQSIREVRVKKFCNSSCFAKFTNHLRIKPKLPRFCNTCSVVVVLDRRIVCDNCKEVALGLRTKGELFKTRCNWQSARSSIRRHATLVWKASGMELKCSDCGYDRYVEIAHIKAVSEFPNEAQIQQINAVDNLKALCPNHHWEFDNLLRGRLAATS